ncbi:hypothetical protein GCM10010274_66890 [Streptomyces lavendofoliae]|uniref:Uncharacterized protein n=1 Tax=Streptomyces lavendofoliae TaxID=67314 RepID=A0A918I6L9_9ACTN|nr:hypothetical protein GCM10010274_66890 [Streptomyces lavendofoliae]
MPPEAPVLAVAKGGSIDVPAAAGSLLDDAASPGRQGQVVALCALRGPGGVGLDVCGILSEQVEQPLPKSPVGSSIVTVIFMGLRSNRPGLTSL